MFDSKKTIQTLIDASQTVVTRAQAEHDKRMKVLTWIPENSPTPDAVHCFGYCSDYSMQFKGPSLIEELLKVYPPVALVDVSGSSRTQKPIAALTDNDKYSPQERIHPVLVTDVKNRRWWTETPFGLLAVEVLDAGNQEGLPNLELYSADSQRYSSGCRTFYYPHLARSLALVDVAMPEVEAWNEAWNTFIADNSLNAAQTRFINVIRSQIFNQGINFSRKDLPPPRRLPGGTALAVPTGTNMHDVVEALSAVGAYREAHPWDRLGDFDTSFTPEQVEKLLELSAAQFELLPRLKAEAARKAVEHEKTLDLLEAWIRKYIATLKPFKSVASGAVSRIAYRMGAETGLPGTNLNWLQPSGTSHLSIRFSIEKNVFRDITIPLEPSAEYRVLLPQEIPVEYADPSFV